MPQRMKNILKSFSRECAYWFGRKCPQIYVYIRYWFRFHKLPHLKNPHNLNEKILYLALNTDTSMWTELADKYRVREYVENCGYAETLPQLYGVWKNAEDIDFDSLPQSFVLKTNHGCGDVQIIKDKSEINLSKLTHYFNHILRTVYGGYEKHYARIKPLLIAEQLLVNDLDTQKYSNGIIDYKLWCFNGICHYIAVYYDRDSNHNTKVIIYDCEWKAHPEYYNETSARFKRGYEIPKPGNLDKMIRMAETLSKPFPCVRVDLYNISGKIYFGEMTFTSSGGMMINFTDDFLDKAGSVIDINYAGG